MNSTELEQPPPGHPTPPYASLPFLSAPHPLRMSDRYTIDNIDFITEILIATSVVTSVMVKVLPTNFGLELDA